MKYEVEKWHGWNGGECPVHPETVVEVQFDTDRDIEKAKFWEWIHLHEGAGSDIIAFRVIKEHKEPREVWMSKRGSVWVHVTEEYTGAVLFREVVE